MIRQYKNNMSSRDVLAKYALSSDQKEMLNFKVFDTTDMIKISEYNKLRNWRVNLV